MIKNYEVYTKTKTLQYKPYKKLQILPIFERIQGSIIIDFIIKLFKSKDLISNTSYNRILIIIKRLIKYNKFIPINESYLTKDFADIVIREIISNHKLPDKFITNKNITFVLQFFITLTIKLEMNNKLSTTFHL